MVGKHPAHHYQQLPRRLPWHPHFHFWRRGGNALLSRGMSHSQASSIPTLSIAHTLMLYASEIWIP